MNWLEPIAWWGLAGLAVPVLIHLLARAPARRFPFPSLRFLRATQMAALRRRAVSDWLLLTVRMLVIVAATAALAGPVFVSEARRAAWNQRVARAFVLPANTGDAAATLADEEARASFSAARFESATLPDGIGQGVDWLRQQAPAAREIVIAGDLREGSIIDRDLELIPPYVGIRFLPVARTTETRTTEWRAIAEDPTGRAGTYQVQVTADELRTSARYQLVGDGPATELRIAAGQEDQPYAEALIRAVLRQGVLLGRQHQRRVTIAFTGASLPELQRLSTPSEPWMRRVLEQNPDVRGGEAGGTLFARADMRVTDSRVLGIVTGVIHSAFAEPLEELEPRRITPATLARWSRPSGPSPADALPADEGDRRWFWVATVMLIAVEHVVRRNRRVPRAMGADEDRTSPERRDVRVA